MSPSGVTILVVEDEPAVLAVIRATLERAGYAVLAATSAESAIALSVEHAASIRLLVLDVIMPQVSGPQLRERLQAHLRNSDIPTVFMSGYPDAVCDSDIPILDKPFTADALLNAVYQAIAVPSGTAPEISKKPLRSDSFHSYPRSAVTNSGR